MNNDPLTRKTAVLASVQLAEQSDQDHDDSLTELGRLVKTLGFEVIGRVSQKRRSPSPGTVLGEGKLRELAGYTGGPGYVTNFSGKSRETDLGDAEPETEESPGDESEYPSGSPERLASVVVIDSEITPTQLKNLEEATGVEVLDRTGVILEIFSRHARSREARLQVEIAKLNYLAPRLRASSIGGDRQGGGIGAKGAGETSHELDRRRIRDRIVELQRQLDSIRTKDQYNRQRRREDACVALVGYTNAGKSSLMRALTGSDVLVEDKLFATLDTKVRSLHPPSVPPVLVSDTVGFIKQLPHDLVASFRSTLDEALNASVLLFTVDAADPTFRSQIAVTEKVLEEIGATEVPKLLVMNKIDCLDQQELALLREEFPEAIFISTRSAADIAKLRRSVLDFFEQDMIEATLSLTYSQGGFLGELRKRVLVIGEVYENDGVVLTVKAKPETIAWIKKQSSDVDAGTPSEGKGE